MMTTPEQLEALYGPPAAHSEYSVGDIITYRIAGELRRGEILYVAAPQQVLSQHLPTCYTADAGLGIPDPVYSGDIIERSASEYK